VGRLWSFSKWGTWSTEISKNNTKSSRRYEVAYTEGQECGGGYLKLISAGSQEKLDHFTDKTPYTVMFGPDKCGTTSKVHFILRHQNPKNGSISVRVLYWLLLAR